MTESIYPTQLAAWVKKQAFKKRQQDATTVAFLAVRLDIVAAIDSGYAITTIYKHMRESGKVACSYETFRKHVRRFINADAPLLSHQVRSGKSKPDTSLKKKDLPSEGFNFNPKPNEKDLF